MKVTSLFSIRWPGMRHLLSNVMPPTLLHWELQSRKMRSTCSTCMKVGAKACMKVGGAAPYPILGSMRNKGRREGFIVVKKYTNLVRIARMSADVWLTCM